MQTDGHNDATVAFRNFAKTPKMYVLIRKQMIYTAINVLRFLAVLHEHAKDLVFFFQQNLAT